MQQCTSILNLLHLENLRFWREICSKYLNRKKIEKINTKISIDMYPCTKFQVIWSKSDFGQNLPEATE